MKLNFPSLLTLCLFSLCALGQDALTERDTQGNAPDLEGRRQFPELLSTQLIDWHVAKRGENFAVMEKVRFYNLADGTTESSTNRYTVLGNGMHYFENEEWKESEDIIEVIPEGAVARQGPNRTIFSPDLNAEAVFDVETSAGDRIRGGVRSLQITDAATGVSRVIAEIKQNAPGELVPPNRIVYRDAFDGLKADVVYVWTRDRFSQNILFLERPELPQTIDAQSARLEVITEFMEAPDPIIRRGFVRKNNLEIADDVLLIFNDILMEPGKALLNDEGAFILDSPIFLRDDGIHVAKEWLEIEDGSQFLIESVDWEEAKASLDRLPPRQQANVHEPSRVRTVASQSRPIPKPIEKRPSYPIRLAATDYQAEGFLVDMSLSGSQTSYTFDTGQTYYIENSFTVGDGTITFNPGCVIKYDTDAYFKTTGSLDFPETEQKIVFTSKNDNGFGQEISGSSGSPSQDADPALWMYYIDFETIVENAWFRWSQRALDYRTIPSVGIVHEINESLIQESGIGIYADLYSNVDINDSEKCDVTTSTDGSGSYSGSLTSASECIEHQFQGLKRYDLDELDIINTPPDPMGAVGTNYFIEIVNSYIAIYEKTSSGSAIDETDLETFFNRGGNSIFDPRIFYDTDCQRWIVSALDKNTSSFNVVLAISNTNSPPDLSSSYWNLETVDIGITGQNADYPTMGIDENGLYINVHYLNPSTDLLTVTNKLIAIYKNCTDCLNDIDESNGDINVIDYQIPEDMNNVVIQPVVNYDSISGSYPCWLVAKGEPTSSTYSPGSIYFMRVEWNGNCANSSVSIITNAWNAPYSPGTNDFYDLDLKFEWEPPQKGGGSYDKAMSGSRLMMALIRNGYLYSCQHVGLKGTNGDFTNDGTVDFADVDRTGIQCYIFQMGSTNYVDSATELIYDDERSAVEGPYYFFFPSIAVNSDDSIVVGFKGARENEFYGAFYSANQSGIFSKPKLIIGGEDLHDEIRYGDYSHTTVDPSNKDFIWTVQQYTKARTIYATNNFGTVITKLKLN